MPNKERFRPGFFKRVILFSAPAGVIAAVSALISFETAMRVGETVDNSRAAATVTLFIVATAVMTQSARPLNPLRIGIVALMVLMFLAVLFIPFLSNFFALSLAWERYSLVAVGVGIVGAILVAVATFIADRWRRA